MRRLRSIVLAGLALLLPTVISIWVLYKLFVFLDGLLRNLIARYTGVDAPGIGVAAVIVIVLLAGLFAGNYVGKRLIGLYNSILERIPVFSSVYRTFKQVSEAVLRENPTGFRKVGLVEFPRRGARCICFITSEETGPAALEEGDDSITVFVPTSPNPTSGFMLVVPAADVEVLDISVEEGVRMIVTAGMIAESDTSPLRTSFGRPKKREKGDVPPTGIEPGLPGDSGSVMERGS
jgi:uncharacterized membrane protein